jgi:hypothetical protein
LDIAELAEGNHTTTTTQTSPTVHWGCIGWGQAVFVPVLSLSASRVETRGSRTYLCWFHSATKRSEISSFGTTRLLTTIRGCHCRREGRRWQQGRDGARREEGRRTPSMAVSIGVRHPLRLAITPFKGTRVPMATALRRRQQRRGGFGRERGRRR